MLKIDFLSIFFKKFNKPGFNFCVFGRKTLFAGNSWENLRKFWKDFFRKLQKCIIFSIFFKSVNKLWFNFLRLCTKSTNCWENLRKFWHFLMKILYKNWNFYFFIFFRKFVTKNRAFGSNTTFLQHFFGLGGGSPFALATPLTQAIYWE